jgi:outer membrane protein OmpA-like peptidoglycan-associated protein
MGIRYRAIAALTVVLLSSMAGITPVRADEKQEVNVFYKTFVSTMKTCAPQAARLAQLVEKDRHVATRCLDALKQKSSGSDAKADAYRLVASELEHILLLTGPKANCSDPAFRNLGIAARQQVEEDDRVFYLSQLARKCPGDGFLYVELGHLYLKRRQFGLAVAAYQDAVKQGAGSEAKQCLRVAQEHLDECKKDEPITEERVARLFAGPEKTMLPVDGLVSAKLSVTNAIEMRDVLFDEWSAQVKDQFKPSLDIIGKTAQIQFRERPQVGLLVDGHTDRRGPLERNEKTSRDRADAIKQYLVSTFGLDPSRIHTHGYGPSRPVAATDDEAGWALNRRVVFKKIENLGLGH